MTASGEQSIRNLLNEKLNSLSGVLRLGHEACQKGSLEAVAMHIVNNSRMLVRFDRCCLADMRSGEPEIIAVMGVAEVNANSEFSVNMRALLKAFPALERSVIVREESLKDAKASEASLKAYEYFKGKAEDFILIPMRSPDKAEDSPNGLFVWALEFQQNMGTDTEKLLLLLSQLYSVAIWYALRKGGGRLSSVFSLKRRGFTPGRIFAAIAAVFVVAMLAVRVDLSAMADFQLEPPEKTVEYAPFNGTLKKSFFRNGDEVRKGQPVIEYDIEELNYELAANLKEYEELGAELDMVRQSSFVNPEDLAKVKLLEAKRERKKVDIERTRWYLSRSVLKADRDGSLLIEDADLVRGKSVNAGAELYEIMPPGKLLAKVFLNEADASVICPGMKVRLYLHSMPASSIKATVVSVSPRPTIQESRQFCYLIKAELEAGQEGLICGMRGVAKVSGSKVSLGYYTFRNAMLWWRKI